MTGGAPVRVAVAGPERADPAADAVESMRRFGIDPSPENYAVWYAYHRKADLDLIRTIDILISNRQSFDDARMAELRARFGGHSAFAAEATGLIQEALTHVVAALGDMDAGNRAFVSKLDDASGQLGATDPGSDQLRSDHLGGDRLGGDQLSRLRSVVEALAAQTRSMAEENRKLGQELSSTSERMQELQRDLEGVQKEARTDALTSLGNRRAFEDDLRQAAIDAMEQGTALSLIMVDIDHFKMLNDTHGHQTGDEVLKLVGRVLSDSVREDARPCRYGGEEFAILLPMTEAKNAAMVAERIRARVATRRIVRRATGESVGTVTLSLGIAEYRPGETIAGLVQRADDALYAAKEGGRNRVVSADAESGV